MFFSLENVLSDGQICHFLDPKPACCSHIRGSLSVVNKMKIFATHICVMKLMLCFSEHDTKLKEQETEANKLKQQLEGMLQGQRYVFFFYH